MRHLKRLFICSNVVSWKDNILINLTATILLGGMIQRPRAGKSIKEQGHSLHEVLLCQAPVFAAPIA